MLTEKSVTSIEIDKILNKNRINDLTRFISKRETLNKYNTYIRYSFIFSHYSSILITTVAVGYNSSMYESRDVHIISMKNLIWLGISLNIIASILTAVEHMNRKMSKKLLYNIKQIQSGDYIDESNFIDSYHSKSLDSDKNKIHPI
jgi:hypothetical protein